LTNLAQPKDGNCSQSQFGNRPIINGAVIKLSGRYPDKGRAVNEICKEMGYIISGSGKLTIEDEEYELSAGDLVLINPGEKFYWQGEMEMFMPCAPAWTPE